MDSAVHARGHEPIGAWTLQSTRNYGLRFGRLARPEAACAGRDVHRSLNPWVRCEVDPNLAGRDEKANTVCGGDVPKIGSIFLVSCVWKIHDGERIRLRHTLQDGCTRHTHSIPSTADPAGSCHRTCIDYSITVHLTCLPIV